MRNWKASVWLTALALLPACVTNAQPQVASAAPQVASAAPVEAVPVAAGDELPPGGGALTVQWTISGRQEPLDCGGLGIDRFVASLTAVGGGEAEPWDAPCDAFQISIDLAPGTYTGEAVMVDRLDRPVTLNVPLGQIEVVAGRDVVRSVDFPVAAFLSSAP